jgi:hypothetical protein
MATNPKPQPVPKDLPQAEQTTPIEYIGEGAEKVKFTINPKATKYVVHASGLIKEYL